MRRELPHELDRDSDRLGCCVGFIVGGFLLLSVVVILTVAVGVG